LFGVSWQLAQQGGRFELDGRQRLAQFVVNLTREQRPFFFTNSLKAAGPGTLKSRIPIR
jgi:hypothetical protein